MKVGDEGELEQWLHSLNECRDQSLRILAFAQIALCWFLVIPYLVAMPALGWAIVPLLVGSVGAIMITHRSYRIAASLDVVGQFLASVAAVEAVGAGIAAWTFAFAVATTTVLLGTQWAMVVATATTIALLADAGGPAPWTSGVALGGIAITWGMAFVAWLGLRPLKQTLAWAINSHRDARARAEEAERHRGELGRVVKSLNESHERLERLTSDLDRARQAAENARVLKARFASYISHELRTPLNLIIGFSEMMVMAPHTYGEEVLPASYRGDINAIYQSARHLSALINDVLDLSQIDAHRMALDRDDVEIRDIIAEAVCTVAAAYEEKGLRIDVDVRDDLPSLYADQTRIRQVLINLLGNALRFTEEGGVRIRASLVGSDVVVAVSDSGIGIPPDELPRLFDEFRQVERPDDDPSEGSGLGLAIARRFVGLHGGWMRAESQPGTGTTMSFGLPADHAFLDSSLPLGSETPTQPPVAAALPVVAVVGEEPWLVRTSQRYLDGYRVMVVDHREDLLRRRWRREGAVAVVVPTPSDSAGWEDLQKMVSTNGEVPVICCSLRGGRDSINRLGVIEYVDKPFTRERLAEVLRRWPPRRAGRTILVVDDDHEMVRLLSRMIHSVSARYRVLKAYGGAMALEVMRELHPDLVLLDLLMPDVDGYEVLQRMRRDDRLNEIPVVVVTAKGVEDDAIIAGMFGLARAGGFPAGEFMRCLQATLDSLSASGISPV